MTYTAHDPRLFYKAILDRLATYTGKNIGHGEAPEDTTTPYAVLYPLDENYIEASLADPLETTLFSWQVTSIGEKAEQALWMQQRVRQALVGWTPEVAGLTLSKVLRDTGINMDRDDDVQPPLFYVADIFEAFASA